MPCLDCKTTTFSKLGGDYYMVHDEIWAISGLSQTGGELCIPCLESRIGRKLHRYDFTDCGVNSGWFPRSETLLNRLYRWPISFTQLLEIIKRKCKK